MNTHTDSTLEQATPVSAAIRRERGWPLWGVAAGLLGAAATLLLDTRPTSELEAAVDGRTLTIGAEAMRELEHFPNYLGFLLGFGAVLALVIFQSAWRARVEARHPNSIAARMVSGGLIVAAAGLTLAYGWKGALANYGYGGPEEGLLGDDALLVYYVLTDFGPYIPWFGVVISGLGLAWLAWRDGLVSRVLGTVCGLYAVLVIGGYAVSGVPGLAGPVSGLFLVVACLWLAFGRSRVTEAPSIA